MTRDTPFRYRDPGTGRLTETDQTTSSLRAFGTTVAAL